MDKLQFAKLGEAAKKYFKEIPRNMWAYQEGYGRHKDLNEFDPSKVHAEGANLKKQSLPWRVAYPKTTAATVRTLGSRARYAMFGAALVALWNKEALLRDTEGPIFDRVQRKGYVRLPDGRLAQVNPQIDTDLTPSGMWQSLKETLNPLP